VDSWGGPGSGPGEFTFVAGMGIDPLGNVLTTERSLRRGQKFDDSGVFQVQWGQDVLSLPEDVASTGLRIYVVDSDLNKVFAFESVVAIRPTTWGRLKQEFGSR